MSYPPPPQGVPEWQGQPGPPGPADPHGQPAPPYGGYPAPSYGGGPGGGYGGGQDVYGVPAGTSGKATTSLVLGIASLVLCFIGFLLGIPAVIVGMRARKEIRNSEGRTGGDGIALTGIVTGIIGTLLGIVVVALVVGLFAVGSTVNTVVDEACDQAAQDNDPSNDCA